MNADALAQTFIRDFWSADHSIKWIRVEFEHNVMLDEQTMLVGRIDALGINEMGRRFFGEWKTASASKARNIETTKASWRMSPQALTYGVLCHDAYPDIRDFTVRWAFKTNPPTTGYEWYTYNEPELKWWQQQVLTVADEIRQYRRDIGSHQQWPTNLDNCRKFGEKYVCPFLYPACSKFDFNARPEHSIVRISHLDTERGLASRSLSPDFVVLDATRITTWFGCRERYRRE